MASEGIEDCRKCCGGNGYLLSSGISQLFLDNLLFVTVEGDYIVMSLLTGKFLVKSLQNVVNQKVKLTGYLSFLNIFAEPDFSIQNFRPKNIDFRERESLLDTFKFRNCLRILQAADSIKENLMKGKSLDESVDLSADYLLKANRANSFYMLILNYHEFLKKQEISNEIKAISKILTNFF